MVIEQENEIRARMENGVLTITFPKSGRQEQAKKINIA
jgi:HSP20 family molecular chaperone IbpA